MVRGTRAAILDITSDSADVYSTDITVKNGTVYSSGDFSPFNLDYTASSNKEKPYSITFENVTFRDTVSGRASAIAVDVTEGSADTLTSGLTADIVFSGCTFDFGANSGVMMRFSGRWSTR